MYYGQLENRELLQMRKKTKLLLKKTLYFVLAMSTPDQHFLYVDGSFS